MGLVLALSRSQRRLRAPNQADLQGLKVGVRWEVVAGVGGGMEQLDLQVARGVEVVVLSSRVEVGHLEQQVARGVVMAREVEVGHLVLDLAQAEAVGMQHLVVLGMVSQSVLEELQPSYI